MARVSDESRLSVPVSGQLSGVLIERWIVCNPHVHDPIVLANATSVKASTLEKVSDLSGHGPFVTRCDLKPLEDVSHQPVLAIAFIGEAVLAGDLLLELVQHDVLEWRLLLEVLHVLAHVAELEAGERVDWVIEISLVGSSPDGVAVLLQAVQVDDLDVGVVLAGDHAIDNDGHEATVAGWVNQELV